VVASCILAQPAAVLAGLTRGIMSGDARRAAGG
jgi:hypothetical protein